MPSRRRFLSPLHVEQIGRTHALFSGIDREGANRARPAASAGGVAFAGAGGAMRRHRVRRAGAETCRAVWHITGRGRPRMATTPTRAPIREAII